VETNIHYPTDSSLLGDGARVLTRTMKKVEKATGGQLLLLVYSIPAYFAFVLRGGAGVTLCLLISRGRLV